VPGLYGVSAADVAAEIPALFPIDGAHPNGFSAATKPTQAKVEDWILAADALAELKVVSASGQAADPNAKAAPLVKQYIRDYTLAQVMRAIYAGQDPGDIDDAARPYEAERDRIYDDLQLLGSQLEGPAAVSVPRVRGKVSDRELLIGDAEIGAGALGGLASRRF
jgi:hypothetical protein